MSCTSQQNGVSERCNRILIDMVRSISCKSNLPIYLWLYALKIAMYLLNRVPGKAILKTHFNYGLIEHLGYGTCMFGVAKHK